MNKIIKKYYPVERLPDDLRSELAGAANVHIELQPAAATERHRVLDLIGTGRNVHGSPDAVLEHIRGLREDR